MCACEFSPVRPGTRRRVGVRTVVRFHSEPRACPPVSRARGHTHTHKDISTVINIRNSMYNTEYAISLSNSPRASHPSSHSKSQRGQTTTLATRTPLTGYRRVHEARADEARGREGRQERGPRREEGRYGRATATYLTVASHGPCVCSLGPCWQTRRR